MTNTLYWHVRDEVLFYGPWAKAPLAELTRTSAAGDVNRLGVTSETVLWRKLPPNLVVHPSWGDCVTLATDGIHVIVEYTLGRTVEVAKEGLRGPVTCDRVAPEDWDWERNTRKVRVFKRKAPLPPAIIPVNTEMDGYWARTGRRCSRNDHEAFRAMTYGAKPEEFEAILAKLNAASEAVPKRTPGKGNSLVKAAINED